jgi:glycogen phosphorylase
MSNPRYTSRPSEALNDDALAQLALDVRWSWNHSADKLWQQLDPELWDLTHNPWVVLQTVSRQRLERVTSDTAFLGMLEELTQAARTDSEVPRWFQQTHPNSPLKTVAYFSMEYMLSEALPIYSGGLGNVAGDQLKAANDLGVPVIGVGLLYQQGYFRQQIDRNGVQHALFPYNDPGQLPIKPLRDANGDWVRLPLSLPGFKLWVRTWEVQVGQTKLYLLDTNDPANLPEHRGITSELYGGGPELRLRQEQVLGIGGWRLLRALGVQPEVCHLNEGHAAFAVLERALSYMEETGHPFPLALTVTRAGNLFTTHTPVEAGFDRFPEDLMRVHFHQYAEARLHIPFNQLMALGQRDPGDSHEPFNMAYLAIRGSGAVNAVSRLHGSVSRRLFQSLFPRWPLEEIPIRYVTNGVHVPTWDSAEADRIWTDVCGRGCWRTSLEEIDKPLRRIEDTKFWRLRTEARSSLVEYIRSRYARQVEGQGGSAGEIAAAEQVFDFSTLTLGFARRFATYKRPNLLLHNPERLMRILSNPQHPVQLVIAGKAHPQDGAGQAMIRQWNEFIQRAGTPSRVIFLSDYDMLLTERLVGGVDVWVNTPRRPWEASGTSGMKVLVNGGLNLSELDGWWAEAYAPDVGWAIGDGNEHGDDPAWDAAEAEALYTLLEREIIPAFYDRDGRGVPVKWVARMRESMARLTPAFSANRTVREYTENHYLPAAAAYTDRAAQGGKLGAELLAWQTKLADLWRDVRFGALKAESRDGRLRFEVPVYFGRLQPDSVRVELFANGQNGGEPVRKPMDQGPQLPDGAYLYSACAEPVWAANVFTPRIVPYHAAASLPLEASQILWQK